MRIESEVRICDRQKARGSTLPQRLQEGKGMTEDALNNEKVKNHFSADTRQLLAEQHIDDPCAANAGFHQDHSRMIADDFPDDLSVTPERMFAHLSEEVRGGIRSYDVQQLDLVS